MTAASGWTIVADDLTGAADAAAPFAAAGARAVRAFLSAQPAPSDTEASLGRVIALTTAARHLSGDAVRFATREAFRGAPNGHRWFLKIDSVLRGDIESMIEGLLEAAEDRPPRGGHVVVCPAFPAQGRAVVDGRLHVRASSATPLPAPSDQPLLATGAASLHETLARFSGSVTVADATTDADLDAIALRILEGDALAVGSSGLARALARADTCPHERARRPPRLPRPGRLLVVCGTRHPVTLRQLEVLASSRLRPTILTTTKTDEPVPLERLVERCRSELSGCAQPIAGLVLTGGDTALAVLRSVGANGIALEGEVEPGVPYGTVDDGALAGAPVVLKSGGFGSEETLLNTVEFLNSREAEAP